jgi:hypothetical protein
MGLVFPECLKNHYSLFWAFKEQPLGTVLHLTHHVLVAMTASMVGTFDAGLCLCI